MNIEYIQNNQNMKLIPKYQTGRGFIQANPEQAKKHISNSSQGEYVVNRTADNTHNYNSRRGGRTQDQINAENAKIKRRLEIKEKAKEKLRRKIRQKKDDEYFRTHRTAPYATSVFGEGAGDAPARVFNKAVEYGIAKPFMFILNGMAQNPMGSNGYTPSLQSSDQLNFYKAHADEAVDNANKHVLSWTTPTGIAEHVFPEQVGKIRESEWGNAFLNGLDLYFGPKMTKGMGKAAKYVTSPIHGKWTTFDFLNRGPREYRLQLGPKTEPGTITLGSNYLVHGESRLPWIQVVDKLPENLAKTWVDNGDGTFTNKQGKTGAFIETKDGIRFLDASHIYRRPTEYQNVITDEVKKQANYYIDSPDANVSHPILVRQINDNPVLGDYLLDIATGEKVNAPRIIDNGVKPNAMTIALINKAIKEGKYSPNQLFEITYRGDQPIIRSIGRQYNNSWGRYNYSSDQLGNAINYAAHGGPQTQMRFLKELGFEEGTPQWDYAMERFSIINKLQEQYRFKNGKYKNKDNPQSKYLNSYGTHDVNMSYEHIPEGMFFKDRINYERAAREISEFFGAGEEAFDFGGVHQQAIALPDFGRRGTVKMETPSHYENLGEGEIFMGPAFQGKVKQLFKPADKKGIKLNTIGSISRGFRESTIPYFQVINVLDPYFGTTKAVYPEYVIPGLKRGGKIKITANY